MTSDDHHMEKPNTNRRKFLKSFLSAAAALLTFNPLARVFGKSIVSADGGPNGRILLKNGLIVDGSGQSAYPGSVLVDGNSIAAVLPATEEVTADIIDCRNKIIAPGFIDMHSHVDWHLPLTDHPQLTEPFIRQGITTFVGGNCGYGTAGFVPDSTHKDLLEGRLLGVGELSWNTMDEYYQLLETNGISHNLINLSGHGTTRTSMKGYDSQSLTAAEAQQMLRLLEETLDQGAAGISLGLQYEPGLFAYYDELKPIAELLVKHDKILTVHARAYSSLSGTYPLKLFGTPHNLIAIQEMLDLARETGVRLQFSHLIFVGKRTWKTVDPALEMFDQAIADGVDVKFDTYAYHCGKSKINVFLPDWFLAHGKKAFSNPRLLRKVKFQIGFIEKVLGFGYEQIQITNANHPDLLQFNGMFLSEIARERDMKEFDCFIDIAEKTAGTARVLNHRYSNPEIVSTLMQHPAALFMTDADVALEGVQNPGAFGCFPRFLQIVRESGNISLEESIRKMTGASADRFQVTDRGYIREGLAADITVFDRRNITDRNTDKETSNTPTGIEQVFINGKQVLDNTGQLHSMTAGKVVRL